MDAENRVLKLEDCDCKKSCKIDGVTKADGDEWNVNCQTCKCERGNVTCNNIDCGEPKCKNPVPVPGQCCPVCKSKYIILSNMIYFF